MNKKQFHQALQRYFSRRGRLAWAARQRAVAERKRLLLGSGDAPRLTELHIEVKHYEEAAIALWYEAGRVSQMSADDVWMEFWGDEYQDVSDIDC
jgi:hypothetical protein